MKCDLCNNESVTFVRYNGSHLCADHFKDYFVKRVKKEIRKEVDLFKGDTVGVAVSGGKDSMVTLSILHSLFNERNGIRVVCISIDEGIEGYRPPSLDIVRKYCSDNGIEYRERSFAEMDLPMDDIAPVSGSSSPCTYCGVFRRKLMNDEARKVGAKYLATGHNLDDVAQSVMMNLVRGDIDRLARLGPHTNIRPGLIPRFYPLRMVPEKESLLYALVAGIPFWDGECPYWKEALRNEYRDVVDGLEDRSPGTKYSIVSTYDKLRPLITPASPHEVKFCFCGEPCNGKRCKACEYEEVLKGRIGAGKG
ncbi:MAG: TIGR00269 family protein [archaeon]|nr:TIGR00269 family protein [archaeon]